MSRCTPLVWGPSCYALKDGDLWISWSALQRVTRLKLIVQNRRFLVLAAKGQAPNLASQAMGAALRVLPDQWQEHFGYRPLLAESFTDPETHAGTAYKASHWEPVGHSAGYRRHRADFYVPNDRPERLWLRELCPKAHGHLRARQVPADSRSDLVAPSSGVLPLKSAQQQSLLEVFRRGPDPRAPNTQYRLAPVLVLIAVALLVGRRAVAEIARFATTLKHPQRRQLGLPRKQGTRAFYKVPGYGVFHQVLTRMDAAAFAARLNDWLRAQAGTLPQALALDGKIITADPLHCQHKTAHASVEKGGDFLFQIKGNQPHLLQPARAWDALPRTPFLPTPKAATGGSKSASFTPSPASR